MLKLVVVLVLFQAACSRAEKNLDKVSNLCKVQFVYFDGALKIRRDWALDSESSHLIQIEFFN